MNETAAASHIILDAAQCGAYLWRNNVGVLRDINGRPVRYGLANESKEQNERIKSSDYIGVTPTLITQEMVGQVVGIFTAVETKKTGWKFRLSDKRAVAQKAFHDIVLYAGGYAGFASTVVEWRGIVRL